MFSPSTATVRTADESFSTLKSTMNDFLCLLTAELELNKDISRFDSTAKNSTSIENFKFEYSRDCFDSREQ